MNLTTALLFSRGYSPPGSQRINPDWTGVDPRSLAMLMDAFPNFAKLGAIGPDLFFFLPDFRNQFGISVSSVLITVLNFLEELYEVLDPYIEKYERYLGPIEEDIAEELSRLTGGLSESVGNILGELLDILITKLEVLATEHIDFWEFFSLGLNKGYDEQAFLWSDMLHYRNTGQFARALWNNAQISEDPALRAYALGYTTHVATDVTGHAFVNAISGGPFRLHWQRHHLVENHMDAHWYLNDPRSPRFGNNYPQLTESALYYDIAFQGEEGDPVPRPAYPMGNTLRENWERRRRLDIDSELDAPIADLLLKSMIDVFYQNGKHPEILQGNDGRPSADLIRTAYDLLFRFLKLTTLDGFSHEPPDPPDVFPNLDFPTLGNAFDDPPGDGDNFWDDLLDFTLAAIAVLAYIVLVAVYLATLPWAILADIITFPLRLALWYAFERPLFQLLKTFRQVLVMTGYLLPMEDEIAESLIHLGNTTASGMSNTMDDMKDVFGGAMPMPEESEDKPTFRDPHYPHAHPPQEWRQPWSYPSPPPALPDELPLTTAGPYPEEAGPSVLFDDRRPDPVIRDRFEEAATPAAADAVGREVTPHSHLGDVVGFSEYLLWLVSRDDPQPDGTKISLVDWNMDADRGYGYHCWDWNRHPLDDPQFPPQKDPEGEEYAQPCTWPPQADPPFSWNPSRNLEIHWVGPGLEDPGCQSDTTPPPSLIVIDRPFPPPLTP
jgi:hypothetical protein